MSLSSLPDEIINLIFLNASTKRSDLLSYGLLCKRFLIISMEICWNSIDISPSNFLVHEKFFAMKGKRRRSNCDNDAPYLPWKKRSADPLPVCMSKTSGGPIEFHKFIRSLSYHCSFFEHGIAGAINVPIFLRKCSGLVSLDLSCSPLVDFRCLRSIHGSGRLLSHLNLSLCTSIVDADLFELSIHCKCLETVVVDGSKINGHGLAELSKANANLRKLSVSQCQHLNASAMIITITHAHRLRALSARNINLPMHSWILHSNGAVCCSNMTAVDFTGDLELNDARLAFILRPWKYLEEICLEQCKSLTDDAFFKMADYSLPLKRINLTHVDEITDRGLHQLLKCCGSRVEELMVSKCLRLTNKCFNSITEFNGRTLLRFYAAGCRQFTNSGIIHLIRHCRRLQTLSVPGCSISDAAVFAASRYLHSSLLVAQFSFCRNITASAIVLLASTSTQLTVIQLIHCDQILQSFIRFFSQPCPPHLYDRHHQHYCALRQPNIQLLGLIGRHAQNDEINKVFTHN